MLHKLYLIVVKIIQGKTSSCLQCGKYWGAAVYKCNMLILCIRSGALTSWVWCAWKSLTVDTVWKRRWIY